MASSLVVAELLVKPLREGNRTTIQIVETLMYNTPGIRVYPVDSTVAWRAAVIRSQRRMPLVDAIIAATALE
ncbi:MAG: PIN domain-containing protein [Dehalococcoidia bacterium]|nr:PIN domain-containing protein [Dehalococcoidia bacterium]